jgi:hypothetical protein
VTLLDEPFREMTADEPRAPRDQYLHRLDIAESCQKDTPVAP